MMEIRPYLDRAELCRALGICDRTLDNWIAKGFPRAGRHGKWKWAKVEAYMDGPKDTAVGSAAADREAELREMVINGSKSHFEKHGRDVLGRPRRVRGEPELH